MIVKVIIAVVVLIHSTQTVRDNADKNVSESLIGALQSLESQIQQRIKKDQELRLKFSRLFETNLANQEHITDIQEISIIPSINIPFKDNFYYSLMVKKNQDYFTLRGDPVYSGTQKNTFLITSRNQYTFFAELLSNKTIVFHRLKVFSKQPQLETQISLDISGFYQLQVDSVLFMGPLSHGNYALADHSQGLILYFDRQGILLREIKTEGRIRQIQKQNTNLVVLTDQQLFYLNMNRNASKVQCLLPEASIEYFTFQDSSNKFMYAYQNGYLYHYDLSHHCRPIRSYHLPYNSTFFLTSQLIFVESKGSHYAINYTDGVMRPYTLPIQACIGASKYYVTKKLVSQYIFSRICLQADSINISHVLLDMQQVLPEMADFSKFRIPLLLFSFGVIIYVTVKNKKKENVEQQSEKAFKNVLLGKKKMKEEEGQVQQQSEGLLGMQRETAEGNGMKFKSI